MNRLFRHALLAFVALLSGCALSGARRIPGYALPLPAPEGLTLLCWNIQKAAQPRLAASLDQAVQRHRPDLLFLQEARPERTGASQLGGILAPAWRKPMDRHDATGVFTAARPPAEGMQALHAPDRELGLLPKAALLTRHALHEGCTLLAVNVHGLNFETGKPENFLRQLAALHEAACKHAGPMILAGDFNAWSGARDQSLCALAASLDLQEAGPFEGARKTGDQGRLLNGLFGVDPALPLDRVFYRGLELDAAEVLELDGSDHAPLLVRFRRPER